ncbi:unnamed protein product [Ilex paraguariensis]|uniref:Uncharacterized protein n=1 Tax=Ilex paraguariensis TaxID=185542 RepID=A0ABC8RVA3_9AQUA
MLTIKSTRLYKVIKLDFYIVELISKMSRRGNLHDPSGGQVFFPEEIVRPDDLGVEEKPDCPPCPETKVIVVEKIVPGPERVVEKIVPGPERLVEKIVPGPERIVEKIVPGPERIVEKFVPGPERIVEKIVPGPERIVEKLVPGPERVVEKIVPGPERVVEKIVPGPTYPTSTSSSHGGNMSWEQYLTSGVAINWNNADVRYHANRLGINIPGGPSPYGGGGGGGRWCLNSCGQWVWMP